MLKKKWQYALGFTLLSSSACFAAGPVAKESKIPQATEQSKQHFSDRRNNEYAGYKAFTGKVLGNGVRMRLQADVESSIVKELRKDEMIVIVGEKNDFYAVEAPSSMRLYVFRSFILDNVVEGNRVNIRLAPELTSPVVGYMTSGEHVEGRISEKNHKWLEIPPPKHVRFFVAKEYIERVGGPELKAVQDQKQERVLGLLENAENFAQSEMMKSFEKIDFDKVSQNYNEIINEYGEFKDQVEVAKSKLFELQEKYLQKKLNYLEARATRMSRELAASKTSADRGEAISALIGETSTKSWERAEEAQYLEWASKHHKKTMDDFYEDQKLEANRISGIVEAYTDSVRNKPGDFILRDREIPKAYLYSTFVDLKDVVGKYVTLEVTERPNNSFALPAYFVVNVDQ